MSKPYTVILLRPDYMADNYGQDTCMLHVKADNPTQALERARAEVIEGDYSDEWARADFYEMHDPADYFCVAMLEGWLPDVNPEM